MGCPFAAALAGRAPPSGFSASRRLPLDVFPHADGPLMRRLPYVTLTLAGCGVWMDLGRRHKERSYYGPFG